MEGKLRHGALTSACRLAPVVASNEAPIWRGGPARLNGPGGPIGPRPGSRKPGQLKTRAAENPTASKPVGADPAEGQPGVIYRDFSGFLPFLPEAAWGGWPVLAPILGPTPFLKCDDFRDRSGELH